MRPTFATAFAPTDAVGHAQVPPAIPSVASLAGLDLFFQAAAASTATASGFTLSRGLRVTVGL